MKMKKRWMILMSLLLCLTLVPAALAAGETAAEEKAGEGETWSDVQYVIYLGTNDKDTNKPVFTQSEALDQVRDILIRFFGGYTVQEAFGGWMDQDTEFREYTLVIYLSDTTLEQVHAAAAELIQTFNQSSVLIQSFPTRTEFYAIEGGEGEGV